MPSGNYLLRVETIGLHVAETYPGAQFYIGCVQINVTGGGSATPTGVSFPGAYAGSNPGITIDIYYPVPTTYVFPGGPTIDGTSPCCSIPNFAIIDAAINRVYPERQRCR